MTGLGTLIRKEILESWRTYRLPVVVGLFALVGLSSPLLARYLPEIIEAALGDSLGSAPLPVPTPSAVVAVDQFQKNLGQFGAIAAILLAMGSVATELDRGTAAFVLARPIRRDAFLVAKVVTIAFVLAISTLIAIVIGWIYTAILFEPPAIGGWLLMGLLDVLALCAWAAVTFFGSVVTGSVAAAAGIGIVALLGLSVLAAVPTLARVTPAGLAAPGAALANGQATIGDLGSDLWLPVVATVVLIGLVVGASAVLFRRREL